jgi:hypothetical protein
MLESSIKLASKKFILNLGQLLKDKNSKIFLIYSDLNKILEL